jgi:hypothetical protein
MLKVCNIIEYSFKNAFLEEKIDEKGELSSLLTSQ